MHGFYAHDLLIDYAEGLVCVVVFSQYLLTYSIIEFTSPFNATVVDLLQEAGAQIVGKTNCDEFGMGYLTHSR
jgi:hypothetical protein